MKKIHKWIKLKNFNGYCVMLEGMFNSLGTDIMGMNTIVPLFLAFLGAELTTIGAVTTMQSFFQALMPLAFGGIVAATKSKRKFSMVINGIFRSSILLIPLGLILRLPASAELILFFVVIFFYTGSQPITSLSWNYLVGVCIPAETRNKMMGTLFSMSGLLSLVSSGVIKWIRSNDAIEQSMQYTYIFLIAGFFLASSVLFYLPLNEQIDPARVKKKIHGKDYIRELFSCYRNGMFRNLLYTNIFSTLSISINTFFLLYAQEQLAISADQISNLIIIQTAGLMIGGIVCGKVSQSFGVKRMLQLIEGIGILIPLMGLYAPEGFSTFFCAAVGLFLIGFIKSGNFGFSNYILEIIPPEKTVYHIVTMSLTLLPFSFSSILVGGLIARFSYEPVFVAQILFYGLAFVFSGRLKLLVFTRKA